jgi:hypothetical protein
MKLIALTGLPRSGKDTIASYLNARYGFSPMAFASPLKFAASVMLGMTPAQMEGINYDREQVMPEWGFSVRTFLRYLGTEVARQFDPDFWVKRVSMEIEKMRLAQAQGQLPPQIMNMNLEQLVFTDCRFENEATWVRSQGGMIVEVTRPGIVGSAHVSDAGLKDPEYKIANDGVGATWQSDLHAKVDIMMAMLASAPQLARV